MAAAFVMSAPQAQANSMLELISGGNTVTVAGVAGLASYNGSVGAWNINVTTGTAAPVLGPNSIDVNSVDSTTTGTVQTLTILWSANGITGAHNYTDTVGGTLSTGLTDVFSSYYDTTGTLDTTATALTAAITESSSPFAATSNGGPTPGGPYALTEEVVISGATAANSITSFNDNLSALPDGGATLTLLGGAMTAMAMIRSKVGKLK